MSKAERRAWEAFPDYKIIDDRYVTQKNERSAYKAGYQQAEKDLELTWKDMQNIRNIIAEMMVESYTKNSSWSTHEEFSKEVLKRFKEKK